MTSCGNMMPKCPSLSWQGNQHMVTILANDIIRLMSNSKVGISKRDALFKFKAITQTTTYVEGLSCGLQQLTREIFQ